MDPSLWPLVGSVAAGFLAIGGVLYLHDVTVWVLLLGVALTLATMFVWWRDVILEASDHHTEAVRTGLRYGMALFILSEVMFFVAFFWAFFDASLLADSARQFSRIAYTGGVWPPKQITPLEAFDVPFLNTLVLLLSGCTITWAHYALQQDDRKGLLQGLACTIALGLFFSSLQAYEYAHASFGFTEGVYSSTFYMATGFHGFHVLIGTSFLIVCFLRARAGHFTSERHVGFEAAAWYWHFVDVVWLFLFTTVYWWGGH